MMKKFFILCYFLVVVMAANADGWIDFEVKYNDPNHPVGGHRVPVQPPFVYIEDCTLSFNAFEDDCAIQLLDENEVVVFSNMIPAGTTSFLLPTTLEGEYQIQLIYGNFIFTGYIEL